MLKKQKNRNKICWLDKKAVIPTQWGEESHRQWGIMGSVGGPTFILQLLHHLQHAQRVKGVYAHIPNWRTHTQTHTDTYIGRGVHLLKDSHTWFMALFSQVSTATPTCRRRSNRASAFNFIVFGERGRVKNVKNITYITARHSFPHICLLWEEWRTQLKIRSCKMQVNSDSWFKMFDLKPKMSRCGSRVPSGP